jgi:transposase
MEADRREQRYESWELPAVVWTVMEPLLPTLNAQRGRPRQVDLQRIAAGVFFVLRTGIQWHAVPREQFGPSSTIYYYFRQWTAAGVFRQLWVQALELYDTLEGIDWDWLSVDGAMRKAPLGGEKKWTESNGPWEGRDETQFGLGGTRNADRYRDRRGELSRSAAVSGDVGCDRAATIGASDGRAPQRLS